MMIRTEGLRQDLASPADVWRQRREQVIEMPAEAKRRGVAALTNARGDRVDLPHRILARPRPRIEIAANDDRDVASVVRAGQPCERGRLRRAAGTVILGTGRRRLSRDMARTRSTMPRL